MTILLLRPVLNNYGVSKVLIQLAKELNRRGHRSIVASDNRDWFKAQIEDAGIIHCALPIDTKNVRGFVKALLKMVQLVRSERIDIIHSHHRWTSFIAYFVCRWLKLPLVTTYHGIHEGKQRVTLWGDRVISVSDDARSHLIRYHHLEPAKIVVVPNGIEVPCLEGSEVHRGRRSRFKENSSHLLANIARMSPEKDQTTLFKSMKIVTESYPNVLLLMVGTGPLEGKLKELSEELSIAENVMFLGELKDVTPVLIDMDFLVLSSVTEGLPISVLESLAYCKPVVATSVGDIPKIVRNGETGFLVSPRAVDQLALAIKRMIEDEAGSHRMGKSGRQLVQHSFSVPRMASETEKVYLSLISHGGKA